MAKPGNYFKRGACLCFAVLLALSGCSKDETSDSSDGQSGSATVNTGTPEKPQYVNLNLDNTVVTEHSPLSGEWKILRFDVPLITPDTFTVLKEAAEAFGGYEPNGDNVLCHVFFAENPVKEDDVMDITYNEMKDDYYEKTTFMRYVGDDFYMDVYRGGRIEAYNRKTLREILGITHERTWSWSPDWNDNQTIKSYDFRNGAEIADHYPLNGADVSVSGAAKYAGELLNSRQLPHISSKLFTYTPLSASVLKYNGDIYAYNLIFQLNYDGVPLDASFTAGDKTAGLDNKGLSSEPLHTLMLTGSSVDWIWTPDINDITLVSQETCGIKIDYNEACRLVSEALSQEHVFPVSEAELLYCSRLLYEDSTERNVTGYTLEPMWQFSLRTDTQLGGLCVNVNAVTGEVHMRRFWQ